MKKAHLLLLILPVVTIALYLRSLASWRPQKLFVEGARISQLTYSSDSQTLLVAQDYVLSKTEARLTALDATQGYIAKWSNEGGNNLLKPRFLQDDSRILVTEEYEGPAKVLAVNTGHLYLEREL